MTEDDKGFGETLGQLIDKLAGKGSDFKITFQDLTLEIGMLKAKVSGSIVFDVLYVSEKK